MKQNINKLLYNKTNFDKYANVSSALIKGSPSVEQLKYSIVIPTYKRVTTLIDALESARNQDYEGEYNIIIVDNNPERGEETEKYVSNIEDERILYYKNSENIGMTGNWNRCVELCNGVFMIMVHDDDLLYNNFLSVCHKILTSHPDIDGLYPLKSIWHNGKEDKPKQVSPQKIVFYKLGIKDYLLGNDDAPSGVLIKRNKIIEVGGFNDNFYPSQDYYFNVMASKIINLYRLTMPLSIYRWSVNESMKLNTILALISKDIPLKEWIMDEVETPNYFRPTIYRFYYAWILNMLNRFCPDDLKNIDTKKFILPYNKLHYYLIRKIVTLYRKKLIKSHRLFLYKDY